jgi:Ca2+-transporting ATPase
MQNPETMERSAHPWTVSTEEALSRFSLDSTDGLSEDNVRRQRNKYGINRIRQSSRKSAWKILLEQFPNLIMLVLFLAALLSFIFGEWVDGIAIIVAMLINVVIGFVMELRATRSMEALQQMDRVNAMVRREGNVKEIPASEIVPGDIIVLESGQMVTADVRLLEANRLQCDESALTGESVPVSKHIAPLDENTPLAERNNMAYKGTSVTRGSGEGIVIGTGMDTEIGTIASLVEEAGEKSDPLEKQLDSLAGSLVKVIILVSVMAGISGLLTGKELMLMIQTVVVLFVAAVPEGLPVVATVALARGMKQMAGEKALVRRLTAVQTLGSTNVIFTDKTGTLTENQMTVTDILLPDKQVTLEGRGLETGGSIQGSDPRQDPVLEELLQTGVLCTNASLGKTDSDQWEATGDPMEVALLVAGMKGGINKKNLLETMPEEKEIAFDPSIKMMATYNSSEEAGYRVSVKGAPEAVLEACTHVLTDEGKVELKEKDRGKWLEENSRMAREGLRMLALAVKFPDTLEEKPYEGLTLLGLAGLLDPPREEVRESIEKCHRAGIRVIMVTGDQEITAKNVGKTLGLMEEDREVVPGSSIPDPESSSEQEQERITRSPIFCRVSPGQKLDIISIYQKRDNIVAMTGDGVNDAPALKRSDIGVAMGKRGQQVARESADVILQDDNFSTILVAVKHGRTIFNNIRQFVVYLISGNLGEILMVTLASLAGQPLPLLPLQILYLNAINDAFPALALGMGKADDTIMDKPPRPPGEPILTRSHWFSITWYGILIAASVLAAFFLALYRFDMPTETAVSISFLGLALGRLWHVINMREPGTTLLRNRILTNPYLGGALVLSILLITGAVLTPGLSDVLDVTNPGMTGWILVAGASLAPAVIGQIVMIIKDKIQKTGANSNDAC